MKKFIIASLALVAFVAPAIAADMPTKAPVMVAPVYNWTGLYVGGVVGDGWGTGRFCEVGFNCQSTFVATDPKGWNAGVTLGYNWQLANWVLGIEGDWSWGKLKVSGQTNPTFGCGGTSTCDISINSIGTVRGRVGYAFGRVLPYLTAGAAFSNLYASMWAGAVAGTTIETDFVWGVGVEAALIQNWSAKIEYLNISNVGNFVFDNGMSPLSCGAAQPCYVHLSSINLVRLGLNYRFGGTQ